MKYDLNLGIVGPERQNNICKGEIPLQELEEGSVLRRGLYIFSTVQISLMTACLFTHFLPESCIASSKLQGLAVAQSSKSKGCTD